MHRVDEAGLIGLRFELPPQAGDGMVHRAPAIELPGHVWEFVVRKGRVLRPLHKQRRRRAAVRGRLPGGCRDTRAVTGVVSWRETRRPGGERAGKTETNFTKGTT